MAVTGLVLAGNCWKLNKIIDIVHCIHYKKFQLRFPRP